MYLTLLKEIQDNYYRVERAICSLREIGGSLNHITKSAASVASNYGILLSEPAEFAESIKLAEDRLEEHKGKFTKKREMILELGEDITIRLHHLSSKSTLTWPERTAVETMLDPKNQDCPCSARLREIYQNHIEHTYEP